MISHAPKRSFFMKAVSVFLTLTFLMYNVSFAAPESAAVQATPQAQSAPAEQGPINADDVGIAIDAGTIKAKHNGQTGKMVVHIQDAHCNYEAQTNINRMLDQLTKECGVNIISVEGAEGIVDTTWFKAFPDSEIRKEVATYFMKKGEITGAEFFSITSDYSGTIFGAETRDYYVKNLKAFTEVYPYKDAIEKFFKETRGVADKLKGVMYPADLRELDSKINAFKSKEIELAAFAEFIFTRITKLGIKLDQYPNFKKLTGTLEYEKKINFDIVDQERSNYIDALSKKLTKKQMAELVGQSLKFKKGHIKAVEFYSYLRDLAKEHNIQIVQEYPNLFYYYIYTKLYDGIDNEALFKEIDQIERALKKKMFKNADEEQLDKVSTLLKMYTDLVNIELTNEDYDLYKEYSKEFSLDAVMTFLKKYCDKYALNVTIEGLPSDISTNMPKMVDFYEIAMKRDNALIDNTLSQMEKEGKSRCVLIAGGFHTRGIKELLEKKGYSYVVVTPKITKDVETPYIKVLTNQRTSLEDIITDSAAMPGMGITASKTEVVRAKSGSTMLSPVPMICEGIPMMLKNPKELKALSQVIGAVEGGLTLEDAAKLEYEQIVRIFVVSWLRDVKKKADPEVWARAVKDWHLLLGAFLKKYAQNYSEEILRQQGINAKPGFHTAALAATSADKMTLEAVKNAVSAEFAATFEAALANAKSSGNQAVRSGIKLETEGDYESLSDEAASGMNKVLASFMGELGVPDDKNEVLKNNIANGTVKMETVTASARKDGKTQNKEIQICVIRGLRDAIIAYNAAASPDKQIPADVAVHPGTGKGRWVHLYIDEEDYDVLTRSERMRVAGHELCHIFNPELNERAICNLMANIDKVDPRLMDIRDKLARTRPDKQAVENALINDTAYGDTAARHIRDARAKIAALKAEGNTQEAAKQENDLAAWMKTVKTRRDNIDAMRTTLTAKEYNGYDIIIVSSTTQDEADYQQKVLEKLFDGRATGNADMKNKVCILSVLDESEGGQIIGQINTWRRAAGMFEEWASNNGLETTNLDDIFKKDKVKIAVYHNGGKGERASPATQTLFNSRGAQKIVGSVTKADGTKVDIELIPAVILSTASVAKTNNRSKLDTFWANQVAIGTVDTSALERDPNVPFSKFVVKLPPNPNAKDLADYGTAVIGPDGSIQRFLANKTLTKKDPVTGQFRPDPDFAAEMKALTESPNGSFDFGSFSMSREMHYALIDYWTKKGVIQQIDTEGRSNKSRDIDPALIQVIVPLVNALAEMGGLPEGVPAAATLKSMEESERTAALDAAYLSLLPTSKYVPDKKHPNDRKKDIKVFDEVQGKMPPVYASAIDKIYSDPKKKAFVLESIEFFILFPELFADLNKVVGSINLGADSHWFAYKRMLDLANEKFFMLSDINEENVELDINGEIIKTPLDKNGMDAVRAEDARRMRGITNDAVCTFVVDGKLIRLSYDQVKAGWRDEANDIYVEDSVIQGTTVLLRGSRIVNSVVNDSQGRITAENSYVESSTAKEINAVNSIVFEVAETGSIEATMQIVADAYRHAINDSRFQDRQLGQTRIVAPIGFDPKGVTHDQVGYYDKSGKKLYRTDDEMVFNGNRYSPQEIRNMACNRSTDSRIRDDAKAYVRSVAGITLPTYQEGMYFAEAYAAVVAEDAAASAREKALGASIKALGFGTSGLRGLVSPAEVKAQRPDLAEAKIAEMIRKEGALTDMEVYINTRGFVRFLKEKGEITDGGKIAVGGDLRPTTSRIAAAILAAIKDEGCVTDYVGSVSSPALAYYAMQNDMPSIMITGSHIPADRNGIKFTKKAGEVLKSDEAPILANVAKARSEVYRTSPEKLAFAVAGMFKEGMRPALPVVATDVMAMYVKRYTDTFPADYLAGKKIVVYQHSAVGRDAMVEVFRALGAEVIPIERSDKFVPVDTEKVSAVTVNILKDSVARYNPDVEVSMDGDSDRPLLADEKGDYITGDRLGGIAAQKLEPKSVAVPDTTNDGVVTALREKGVTVAETVVGSPYIVAELESGANLGWEANGGFLLGKEWELDEWNAPLKALPTRDALLPMILTIRLSIDRNQPISVLAGKALPPRFNVSRAVDNTMAGLENYTVQMGKEIMAKLKPSNPEIIQADFTEAGIVVTLKDKTKRSATAEEAADLMARKDMWANQYFTKERGFDQPITRLRYVDGAKVVFYNPDNPKWPGTVAHVRASGNAPDFRLYLTESTQAKAEVLADCWVKGGVGADVIKNIGADVIKNIGMAAARTPGIRAIRTQKASSDAAKRVGDAILSGKPFEIVPYVEPKVWGVDGKGEYWYGAEAGKKSSIVVVGNDRVPMAEVMAIMPEEVLGTGVFRSFGDGIPLVKILTPAGRLSAQFHDSKNELWIVTKVTGENPTIILGFSSEAVTRHGDRVADEYKKALVEYGRALNRLITTLEENNFTNLLNQEKDASKAAQIVNNMQQDVPGRADVVSAYAGYLTAEQGLNTFYNYRPVQVGDVIPIPAYTLHALGAGVEIIEPQIAGPTQSLEDGATFPVRYYFPGFERAGAQKMLDVERVGEMRTGLTVEAEPVVTMDANGVKVERLPGSFEDKGLEVHRITMAAGAQVNVPSVTSFHTLVAIGGNAKVIVGDAEYPIPQASSEEPMLVIPATAGSYRIVADSDVQIIDTFSPVPTTQVLELPVHQEGSVAGTDQFATTESIGFATFGDKPGVYDKLSFLDRMEVPEIVRNRPHTIIVQEGNVEVMKADGTKAADLIPGQKFTVAENFGAYTLVKVGETPTSVKVDYDKNPAEKAVYATYEAVKKHMKEIQAGPVDLILPKEMFVPGGEGTVGSALWEQKQLQTYVSPSIRIRTYSASLGLGDAARMSVPAGTTGILVATESNIKGVDKGNTAVTNFLQSKNGKVRVLAIPDIDKAKDEKGKGLDDKGWFFNREVVGTGLLLAAVNPDTIAQENQGNAADDLQKLMTQLTGRAIPRQHMYYMLAYDEMTGALANLPREYQDSLGWLRFIVQNLLLKMPIKPFDATEQLQQRRKVMWSV